MGKRIISLLLFVAFCFGTLAGAQLSVSAATETPANDTPSEWAAEQVNAAIAAGLVPEKIQSAYAQAATRAEFAALAVTLYENATGVEIADRISFSDTVDVNVEKAAAIGVIVGIGNFLFDPDGQLTREQAALMISRLAFAVGSPLTGHGQGEDFDDSSDISDWAVGAVKQARAAGIMDGVGSNMFAPKETYTREQSVITMARLWDMLKTVAASSWAPGPVRGPGRTPAPAPILVTRPASAPASAP